MPTQIVDVDLQSETGAIAQQTYSDLLIVARDPSVADPTYNDPLVFDTAAQVASEFGEDSDAYAASEEIASRGTRNWWVVMLEAVEQSETFGDSTTTDEATVANTPMQGGEENIDVSVDGTAQELQFVTESPPEKPTGDVAAINTDTGEIVTGSQTDGASAGIEVTYNTLSWGDAFPEMSAGDFDLALLADTQADRSYIGEADELLGWCEGDDASLVLAYANGGDYESDEEAMEASHDIGSYVPSGSVLPIAHKSNDDVAAGVAGRLATKQPWFNPFMDGNADYSFSTNSYRTALIGSPSVPSTFEGGDSNGAGPANVLYRERGSLVLSNSLSTAGSDSNYQFFDVSRTESFIIAEVRRALRGLRLSRDNIPFAPIGRTIIEATLRDRLNQYVASTGRALSPEEVAALEEEEEDGEGESAFQLQEETRTIQGHANVPLSELEIHVPRYDDLDQSERANRVWSGIQITAQLAGNVHTFSVELAVQV